ncbi:hypothetical protein DICPUDRAFT_44993 [Dictyostelium purpureum]|uniref:Ras-associating domain-containing protein n=1 Tax=Dictyostelium purpureum TaxID=5786 RepID=F0Z8E4_DICPU|nr:uncharacterized protein DICPUDRAFT_44993 [Dictyostelium purpureum]EGC39798.1 hypothetical protein DICPUDRAFT_44993 [Dictyostelium purpureum]|eukprot:XP_003283665.1 hypothetical protein DICPUDRAFT_44993 [Dictyostelium purpureum]
MSFQTKINLIEKYDYDLFKAVFDNNTKKVREMIDCGCDINMTEYDKGTTPIHIACARGHKQVLELLVQRGCDVNVQDNRGWTPLHSLVTGRYDILALWLIRQGSKIDLKDKNGFSAIDMAQGWFQQEMRDVSMGKLSNSEAVLMEVTKEYDQKKNEHNNNIKNILQQHEQSKKLSEFDLLQKNPTPNGANKQSHLSLSEVIKVYYRNDSYKTFKVSSSDTALDILKVMCEKINMKSYDKCFDIVEVIKGQIRYVKQHEVLLEVKNKWPIIINTNVDTSPQCHFSLVIRKTAPKEAITAFINVI